MCAIPENSDFTLRKTAVYCFTRTQCTTDCRKYKHRKDLREQYGGSSDLSPQSSLPLQNLSKATQ
jgi:hypothetical protein